MAISALIKATAPAAGTPTSAAPHVLAFETTRTVADDPVFQVWKGATVASKVFEVDMEGDVNAGTWKATAVAAAYGGTGFGSYVAGDQLYASGAAALSKLAIGAAGKIQRSTGAAPAWSTWTIPDTFAKGTILHASALDTVTALAAGTVDGHVLTWDTTTGLPVWEAPATAGGMANGTAGAPGWAFTSAGNTDTGFFLAAADTIGFSAAGVERARLSSSLLTMATGVDIQLASSRYLYLGGGTTNGVTSDGTTTWIRCNSTDMYNFDNSQVRPSTDNTRAMGNASFRWTTVYAVAGAINTSARKFKDHVRDLSPAEGLSAVLALPIHEYEYKTNKGFRRFGPYLDEVPEWLRPNDDGESWVEGNLTAANTLAIQALASRLEALEAR